MATDTQGHGLIVGPEDDDHDGASSYASSERSSEISLILAENRRKQRLRLLSLVSATLIALCAGSISVFSLYGPRFQSRLRYTQFQVNGVAIASSLALYLPISVMGYFCDRVGSPPLAAFAGALFAVGYGLAAWVYSTLDNEYNLQHNKDRGNEATYPLMLIAFICVGAGTCAMYISAVSTSAKNFGKGTYRGLAMALPITGFGLSGMWVSQFASRFLYETNKDGSRGEVNVVHFFLFLGSLLAAMGVLGWFTLHVVDEDELIDEAIEEMEQSGLLDASTPGYDTLAHNMSFVGSVHSDLEDNARFKKNWVLNGETRRFLADHTMWPFALAFLFMVGPGEAFINNLGTVIGTLSPPSAEGFSNTSSATHVSIFGVTSTLARILIGSVTDLVAPAPTTQHMQLSSSQMLLSTPQRRFTISRVTFMLFFAGLMSFGLAFLASGAAQNHADRFWVVSGLVGAGYGAIFSLAPLMVTIIWGVENFATNFGIVATLPALGSTFWGLVYSAVYQAGAKQSDAASGGSDDDIFCYGKKCYQSTFWGEAITVWLACGLLLFAWKGKGGWQQRGVVI